MDVLDFILKFQLLGTALTSFNSSFLLHVLNYTEQHFKFKNVPIFLEKASYTREVAGISQTINEVLEKTLYIFTEEFPESQDNPPLRNYIQDDALNLIFCQSVEAEIWHILDRRLRALRKSKVIVVLEANESDRIEGVERIFRKLWQLQFLNALVICGSAAYYYEPYPGVKVMRVETNQQLQRLSSIYTNLRGYEITTTIGFDIPRIFCIIKPNTGHVLVRGYGLQIFRHFLQRLNATYRIANLHDMCSISSSVNMSQILYRIGTGDLEISMHPYTGIARGVGTMGYPIFKVENCLIVPVRNEIPRYMYTLRPFKWQCWLLLLLALWYIAFILTWTSPLPSTKQCSYFSNLAHCTLDSLSYLLFRPTTFLVHAPRTPFLLIFALLSTLGFFVTTWYCDLLGSFLTTFLVGQQVDTFEDLVAINLPILAKYYEIELLLQHVPVHLVEPVKRLIVPANASDQVAHLLNFNTTYAYYVTEERWIFLRLQQQYAASPIFRWSRICFGMPCIGYPMRLDSHLEQHMTKFIMNVQAAGLNHYWLTSDFKDALYAGYVRLVNNSLSLKSLDLHSLRYAWLVIFIGWMVSTLAFFMEKYHHRRM